MNSFRTLAHISDVHFGTEDPVLVAGLLAALREAAPEVIVVSGDLTQRARVGQFRAAREFLRALPQVPRVVVPGNHDVSATNLLERAVRPLARYRRYITDDLTPFYEDNVVAIAGINTVRVLAAKDGRINRRQVKTACDQLGRAQASALRVVVTHHPMDLAEADAESTLVRRAPMAMEEFGECGVDLFLSGHLHEGVVISTCKRYPGMKKSAVVVHAGTAVSTRTRGQVNGWNLLRVGAEEIVVRRMAWGGDGFGLVAEERYGRTPGGWTRG